MCACRAYSSRFLTATWGSGRSMLTFVDWMPPVSCVLSDTICRPDASCWAADSWVLALRCASSTFAGASSSKSRLPSARDASFCFVPTFPFPLVPFAPTLASLLLLVLAPSLPALAAQPDPGALLPTTGRPAMGAEEDPPLKQSVAPPPPRPRLPRSCAPFAMGNGPVLPLESNHSSAFPSLLSQMTGLPTPSSRTKRATSFPQRTPRPAPPLT
mmetsp:Transcript_19007/g.39702  ORF Transcript_19007/g.39702 Transcript_19007/m.39702 type:complete len:214 (+) Transcript_19007:834-1475(+)